LSTGAPGRDRTCDADTFYSRLQQQYSGEEDSWWLYTESLGVTGPHKLEDCEHLTDITKEDIFVVHSKYVSAEPVPWVSVIQDEQAMASTPQNKTPQLQPKISWIKKLFGPEAKPRTLLDEVEENASLLIVRGYRRLAEQRRCAPTSKTSDQEIISIYKKVLTAFRQASDQRGERLPAGTMNFIAWKFFQVNEMMGPDMLDSHLEYEVQKYIQEGLRPDYRQDLKLF
jgi:hypothetical protein